MLGPSGYLTIGGGVIALCAALWLWGGAQASRANRLALELEAAQTEIARLRAEAQMREVIDHAIDTVQRLDGAGVADWLRNRAGRN